MKTDKNGGLVLITFFLCAVLVGAGIFSVLSQNPSSAVSYKTASDYSPITEQKSEDEKTVSVSSDEARGKIVEEHLVPYSSNLSYNNVYIKNKSANSPDLESIMKKTPDIKIEKNTDAQVLIYHTHATECYMEEERDYYTDGDLTRNENNEKNVTAIGKIIADNLNKAGIITLHDETKHDYPSYTGSYKRSAETVKEYLNNYPSIKVIIDVHRDSISLNSTDRVKPITTVNGNKTAQVMLVCGSEGDGISGFPDWEENLCFASKIQQTLEVMYPEFARPISLFSNKYNQELSVGALLLEVGTESNTLNEAVNAANVFSECLINYLNTLS